MTRTAEQGELLGEESVERMESLVRTALRRKPPNEAQLAGALRVMAAYSPRLRKLLPEVVSTLGKRASFERPLYAGAVRALAELSPSAAAPELERALATEEGGGLATLSAACFVGAPRIAEPLARAAASRHPHLAFAAEVARAARAEASGERLASLAPKIKESHRIDLCVEVFVPLLRRPALPPGVAGALSMLRDAERHLGRWLVFGEIAARAGDPVPLAEALSRAADGPASARSAWGLVAWALQEPTTATAVRPTVELVSRLSDRPSADRDPTFLYRLAEARVPSAKAMLEGLARGPLRSDAAIRAAMYLARDHGRDDLRRGLQAVSSGKQDALRGIAAAALWDLGEREGAEGAAAALLSSRQLPSATWGSLLRAASNGATDRLVSEPNYRRVQLGWVE